MSDISELVAEGEKIAAEIRARILPMTQVRTLEERIIQLEKEVKYLVANRDSWRKACEESWEAREKDWNEHGRPG
jgi:hypothetical protein